MAANERRAMSPDETAPLLSAALDAEFDGLSVEARGDTVRVEWRGGPEESDVWEVASRFTEEGVVLSPEGVEQVLYPPLAMERRSADRLAVLEQARATIRDLANELPAGDEWRQHLLTLASVMAEAPLQDRFRAI